VVAISRLGKEEIERRYRTDPSRVTLIYNGVDLERFHPDNRDRHRRRTRAELGIAQEAWTVLFVGSGFERKGLGPLIEAFARGGDTARRLVVTGKGDVAPYQALAARLGVAERVVWTGPQEQVERLYAAADAVALPARYEPFGNVHLEALASGLPVLSSARAGGAEVVRPGVNGWVAAEPTTGPIVEGLAALRDPPAGGWAGAARASAEPFTFEAQARAFSDLYWLLRGSTVGRGAPPTPDFH
jgi:UDP-glucose:(heptosyl)LPS alpha-1,3-glucosyltransferase